MHLYLTHAKIHLRPIEILIQLTLKENESTLKLEVPFAVATSLPWLEYLYEPPQTVARDSLSGIIFMFWSGHLSKPASLSDISLALFGRVIKLFHSLPAGGESEEPCSCY